MTSKVDIFLFELAGTRYGADAGQVVKVGHVEKETSVGAPLGKPLKGGRCLVFHTEAGTAHRLDIDRAIGVREVPVASLRRLPSSAVANKAAVGAWLDGEQTVLLIDLPALVPGGR
ncbi:MAG: Frizzy aggregation protein FrzB [Myxococcaceae bacterium]|nr:Frizzy aggregation protein FrzB [Myxococcaceae bacterium]